MRIRNLPVVPGDLFARLDEDWHQYGMFSGIATQWWVLGPNDGSVYWVVPDFNGPRSSTRTTYHCPVIEAETHEKRDVRLALSMAAQLAALGIASALAQEQVLPEIT